MTHPEMPKRSRGRVFIGVAIALATALLSPLLVGFSTTVFVFPVMTVFLFGFGGWIPACAGMLLTVIAFDLYFGLAAALMAAAAFALPAAFLIRGIRWRKPFVLQIKQGIAVQILGVLAALGIAYAFMGTDIVGTLMGQFRAMVEDILPPGLIDYYLNLRYSIDGLPETFTEAQLMQGVLDAARRADYLTGLFQELSDAMTLTLPGLLIGSSCLSALLGVAWGNKAFDKGGTHRTYVPVSMWYTPWTLTVGLLATMLVCYLLNLAGLPGAEVATLALETLLMLAFRIQAAISLERNLARAGMKPGWRVVLIVAAEILLASYIPYYGAASALFGSTGAMRQIAALRARKKDK